MTEQQMGTQLNTNQPSGAAPAAVPHRLTHDLEQQCLRILRCTARALANSPGGLRFRAGTQPWLDALVPGKSEMKLSTQQGACV
jgi:hypothetical protein